MKAPAPYNKREVGPPGIYQLAPTIATLRSEWTKTGGGGATTDFPFQISAGTASFTVNYGTVATLAPTDVDTPIDVSGEDGTLTIYIECTLDDAGLVTAASIEYSSSGLPSDTSSTAHFLLGTLVVSSGVVVGEPNQSGMFSMGFVACGRDSADPSTTPGTYYFFVGQSPPGAGGPPPP